ncbi:PAS domain S-box-containing protein [Paenibacillus phyllosphaerae]|uniref:histidine kinase n=1 Tax=Paenibacillus phyllosphaerae TaxID=274593 RepID=A0A7W5B0X7_9BACL|nr:PAS domain-containing protein [Paenibacillus phyllosphaerae]MBB3112232.1 PAS domain S-box-containing protein [Paenibacillus phyllosphaerae]
MMTDYAATNPTACEYETFFQLSSEIMVMLDLDLRVIKSNLAFQRLTGFGAEQACSLPDFLHPDDRATSRRRWHEAAQEERFTIDERLLTASGAIAQIRWQAALSPDGSRLYATGSLIPSFDAFTNNQWHRSSLDQALDCFGIYSAVRDDSQRIVDFRIEYVNQSAATLTGVPQHAQIGRQLSEIYPLTSERMLNTYRQVIETGNVVLIEGLPYADERMTGVLDLLHFKFGDGFAISWRNVASQKAAEAKLADSNKKFSCAFHNAPTINFIMDVKSGIILEANHNFQEITQYPADTMIGQPISELGLWEDMSEFRRATAQILEYGPTHNYPITFLRAGTEPRVGLLVGEYITTDGSDHILFIMNDITDLRDAENRLTQMDKYQMLGSMAASIAHEVRNPMTTVKGFIQLFRQQKDLEAYHSRLTLISSELERASSIITEYLSLASNKVTEKARHRLDDLIRYMLPLLEADAIEHNIALNLVLEEVPPLLMNENEIRQLLLNLFRNAVEAMQGGGELSILTYVEQGGPVLEVRDQGTGIDQKVLGSIFTPFFTTKAHGTGLGLAVCRSIAERHGATIRAHARPDGTSFKVMFGTGVWDLRLSPATS